MSDLIHLHKIKGGEVNSYEVLVKKYQSHIYRICLSQVRKADVAEELAQETFVKAYQSLGSLQNLEKFPSWLKRIAANLCRDYLRSHKSYFVTLSDGFAFEELNIEEPFVDQSEWLESEINEDELYVKLFNLDFEKRHILFLHYIYELPIERIAQRLGINAGAIKKRLERARQALKEEIEMKKPDNMNENFSNKVLELIKRPNLLEKGDNPVAKIWDEVRAFLKDYQVVDGDELISKDVHKSLAEGDDSLKAFEVDKDRVLRAHTTTIVMEHLKSHPNQACKIVGVGRAWRDTTEDKTRLKMFHQLDALWMDKNVSEGQLLTIISDFMETILPGRTWSLSNETFPYTKRGYELYVEYKGQWLSVAGAGEIKESVLAAQGVDPKKFKAIGWGVGLERLAMIKYSIDTIQEATSVTV